MNKYNVSRRSLMKMIASTSFITANTSLLLTGCGSSGLSIIELSSHIIGLLAYPEKASKLGQAITEKYPELGDSNLEQIVSSLLLKTQTDRSIQSPEDLNLFDNRLRARVKQDFSDEKSIILRGWMLSESESEMCMLAYKLANNSGASI